MANRNAGSADGFPQSGLGKASQYYRPPCETLFARERRDLGWASESDRMRCTSENDTSHWNLPGSHSKSFKSRESSFANSIPHHHEVKSVASDSSSDSPETPVAQFSPILDERFGVEDSGNPSGGRHRPPSPRTRIRNSQSHSHQISSAGYLNPMERYLIGEAGQNTREDHSGLSEQESKRLKFLRVQAISIRAQLRFRRRELKARQSTKIIADDKFMKLVRENLTSSNILADGALGAQFEEMQAARNDYGPFEDDYNILEEELDDIDFEMARYEARLTTTETLEEIHNPLRSTKITEEALLGLSPMQEKDCHPLRDNYFSRLGDYDLLLEKYDNLEREYERIQHKISRAALGLDMELLEYELAFLEGFSTQKESIGLDISEVKTDIERIREECVAKGVDITETLSGSEDGSSFHSHDTFSEKIAHDEETASISCADAISNNCNEQQPLSDSVATQEIIALSPSPEVRNEQDQSDNDIPQDLQIEGAQWTFCILIPPFPKDQTLCDLLTTYDEGNKGNRINRWMLHKLRISHLDVQLLARVLFHFLGINNWQQFSKTVAEWQESVLCFWEKDDANKSAAAFALEPTETLKISTTPSVKESRRARTLSTPLRVDWGSLKEERLVKSAPASLEFEFDLTGPEILSRLKSVRLRDKKIEK